MNTTRFPLSKYDSVSRWNCGRKYLFALFAFAAATGLIAAQNVPGTLTAAKSTSTTSGNCDQTITTYTWTFQDTLGDDHTFPRTTETHILDGCSSSCGGHTRSGCTTGCGCPPTGSTSQDEWSSDGQYFLEATAGAGEIVSVAGYLNPKFLIMGVTYAPPGGNTSSSVSYADTTFVGNTSTNMSSFMKNFMYSISVCGATGSASCGNQGSAGGMFGFGGGVAVTGSESNSWTYASNSTNTITTSKQNTITELTPGIPNVYAPLDHDYDIVWVWLNPVVLFTFLPDSCTNDAGCLYWNGYGYDYADPVHEIDVWGVNAGYLNGDFKKTDGTPCYATDATCDPQDADALSRGWVSTQTFGTGETAAINSADLATICAADPFCPNANYLVSLATGVTPPTTIDQRYTLSEFQNTTPQTIDYKQAPLDSTKGETEIYNDQYSTTTSNSQGGSYTYAQGFGLEEKFTVSFFWQELQIDMQQKTTLTWENTWQNTVTNTSTQTDIATITGPPCPALVAPCFPAFSEPHEFTVYQDNLYGTFMFWPNPYFSAAVTPGSQTVKPGGSTSFTVPTTAVAGYSGTLKFTATGLPSGATPTFSPTSVSAGASTTLSIATTSSTAAGTYPITISVTDGSLTFDACYSACISSTAPYATLVVSASPGFSIAATPSTQTIGISTSTSYTVTTTATNGFTGVVDLDLSGLPSNCSWTFSPETITGSGSSTLTITTTGNTPPGTYPLTITGTSGSLTETTTVALVVTGANFNLSGTPEGQSINAGGTATYTVSSAAMSGFTGSIELSVANGLPTGATPTFSTNPISASGSSTLTVTTTTATPAGEYNFTVRGTSGSLTQTTVLTLEVNN